MIVYTAIFNDYDTLRDIYLPRGWQAVCFSDRKLKSRTWDVQVIENSPKIYRKIKILPYSYLPWERTIWIDGNLVRRDNWELLDREGFWVMKHPERRTVHEEATACIRLGKDSAGVIARQVERYGPSPLVATGVLIREPESYPREFALDWWAEVENFSHRDQLSFGPMADRHGVDYRSMLFLEGFTKFKHCTRKLAW